MKLSEYGLAPPLTAIENDQSIWYWSLGITLIELAEGRNPFRDVYWVRIEEWICFRDPPSLSGEEWSAECMDFIAKCLVKNVKKRWSVKQLMEVRDSVCC